MKLTIALSSEMIVETSPTGKGGNIIIDIPDVSERNSRDMQIEFWLEDTKDGYKLTDDIFLKILRKRLKLKRRREQL